jgi:hypothetical protein
MFSEPAGLTQQRPQYGYQQPPPPQQGYGYPPPQQQPQWGQPPPPQQYQQQYHQPPPASYGQAMTPFQSQQAQMYNQGGSYGAHARSIPPPINRMYAGAPPPPPSQTVAFGHGAPNGYSFQYSNCTGRRKALLIGINYFGQKGQLRGCINDVKNLSTYLKETHGYQREDMVCLTDDQQNPMSQPTKANMIRAMHWLVKDARPNDSLVFHYSGHGGQTEDLDGDEEDGYDEVVYPVDFRQAGHIVDDEMHEIM